MKKILLFLTTVLVLTTVRCSYAKVSPTVILTYPLNGAKNVTALTTIGLTYSSALDRVSVSAMGISVTGSLGGKYTGSLKLSADGKTVIFIPSRPFKLGETVSATVGQAISSEGITTEVQTLTFTVRKEMIGRIPSDFHSDDPLTESMVHPPIINKGSADDVQGFPRLTIVNNDNPSDGKMYINNFKFMLTQNGMYRMILDKIGNILFAQSSGANLTYNFSPQKNGTYTYFDAAALRIYILDSNFTLVDTINAAHFYQTDGHELIYNPDGSYYIIAIDPTKMDMRPYVTGGDSNATVLDNVVQEFDKDHNLIFEWRGLDHYSVSDVQNELLTGQSVDYCHMNAIEVDADGNLLLSCRHMDEITKVNRATGEIIWRMGGKNNQFTFKNDTIGYSHQHAIRLTDAGTYTLFDNGNYHKKGGTFSRALEYKLDQINKTATEVWEFRHVPPAYGQAMGYVQRLPNGNTLIGWGASNTVAVTEVGPFSRTVFEMAMDSMNYSYRAYKYPANYIHSNEDVKQVPSPAASGSVLCMPNPVTANAEIRFSVVKSGSVRVEVYDGLGKQVRNLFDGDLTPGNYTAPFETGSLANGVYHVRIISENSAQLDEQIVVLK
jgi:hypothetical protein